MLPFILPELIVPKSPNPKEEKELIKSWAENISRYASYHQFINNNALDETRYAYAVDKVPMAHFKHITGLYDKMSEQTGKYKLPAYIRKVNSIPTMINRHLGDIMQKNVVFTTTVSDQESVEEKYEEHLEEAAKKVGSFLRQQAGVQAFEHDAIPLSESEIRAINFDSYKNEWDKVIGSFLEMFQSDKDINWRYKFYQQGYSSLLIWNKMFFQVFNNGNSTDIKFFDPRKVGYSLSAGSDFIDDSVFAYTTDFLSLQEIMNNDKSLTEQDIIDLRAIESAYLTNTISNYWNNNQDYVNNGMYSAWANSCYQYDSKTNIVRIKTVKVYWRANVEKAYLVRELPNGDSAYTEIDAKKENSIKSKGGDIEYRYDENVYSSTIYGHGIFGANVIKVDVPFDKDIPHKKKLPLKGIVVNTPSFLDTTMDLTNLRIQIFHKLELLLGQVSGKILVLDKAAGGDIVKNIYNMAAFRVIEINTAEEGANPLAANNIKDIDMTLSNSIQQLMGALAMVDQQLLLVSGLNDAAMGTMKGYETASLAAQQLTQSQLVNIPRQEVFFTCGAKILESMCEMIPYVYKGQSVTKHFLNAENQRRLIKLQMPENIIDFPNMSVHVEFSASDAVIKEQIIAASQQVLPIAQDPEIMLSVFKMMYAPTSKKALAIFEETVEKLKKEAEAKAKQQQELAVMQQQAQNADKQQMVETQANAQVKGKEVTANAEIEKQKLKNQHEGEMSDVQKQNELDMMAAEQSMTQE